jgi:XTP/dITP diphosphohydrolase
MDMYFITSNQGKVKSLKKYFELFNHSIDIEQKIMDIPEIQADSVLEVSQAKAKLTFSKLKCPLIVEDGGFCIEALNNFPGVYTRYILDTIGAKGLLKEFIQDIF